MQTEPQISFHNATHSDAVESAIRDKIDDLQQYHSGIIGCRVVVSAPHRDKWKGKIYEVHVEVSIPGPDIAITREAGVNHAHEDIYVAIRDAFDAAQRALQDQVRKMSDHRTKRHPETVHGRVVRIFSEEGYGFIETEFGHEVYFDRDSLTKPAWSQVQIGSQVRFKARDGDKGAYGTQVTLLD